MYGNKLFDQYMEILDDETCFREYAACFKKEHKANAVLCLSKRSPHHHTFLFVLQELSVSLTYAHLRLARHPMDNIWKIPPPSVGLQLEQRAWMFLPWVVRKAYLAHLQDHLLCGWVRSRSSNQLFGWSLYHLSETLITKILHIMIIYIYIYIYIWCFKVKGERWLACWELLFIQGSGFARMHRTVSTQHIYPLPRQRLWGAFVWGSIRILAIWWFCLTLSLVLRTWPHKGCWTTTTTAIPHHTRLDVEPKLLWLALQQATQIHHSLEEGPYLMSGRFEEHREALQETNFDRERSSLHGPSSLFAIALCFECGCYVGLMCSHQEEVEQQRQALAHRLHRKLSSSWEELLTGKVLTTTYHYV